MKKKWIVSSVAGAVVVGSTFGVSAMADSGDDWNGQKAELSVSEAEAAAKEKVQGLTVDHIEKDEDDGRFLYEVDGTDADGRDMDLDIDANSGKVIRTEHDDNDDDDDNNSQVSISEKQAVEAAKAEGAGNVTEVDLDDGYYEVQMEDGSTEYEIIVSGQSGKVVETEQDRDDNDDDDDDDNDDDDDDDDEDSDDD
ncbi:PepSY domain-containing protein [Salibacterium halotolerans]|uniref:Peptidase propeptide and YPEB domain-containing protein n=1 Tax=Salibacterium halotolerans TaxID=1884432 RepID=A0A1I5PBL6_9BACI|nr:PepSY domain-containing protein [Salibacterium halotolerans]SFP30911.1 Peptidase propeptide and YPEB domain-containing protein [Salibacterium halotolerans]